MPPCQQIVNKSTINSIYSKEDRNYETLIWKSSNKLDDTDLFTYLQSVRSVAAFVGLCDRNGDTKSNTNNNNNNNNSNNSNVSNNLINDDSYDTAAHYSDVTMINALSILNECEYDCDRALQKFMANKPVKCGSFCGKKWSDEDKKKFARGFLKYGKNFFKIRKEFFQSNKDTSDLVEYYYYWKKLPSTLNNKQLYRRLKRPLSSASSAVNNNNSNTCNKKSNNGRSNNNNNKDNKDNNKNSRLSGGDSSDNESDNGSDESIENNNNNSNSNSNSTPTITKTPRFTYICSNCLATSKYFIFKKAIITYFLQIEWIFSEFIKS